MDEKDLLIFLTLADTGNLTRTAEKLYLSQPTLSKRLQNMEADLGAALFLRSKQGVTLTPAGEGFVPRPVPAEKRRFGSQMRDDYLVTALYCPAAKYRLVEERGPDSFSVAEDGRLLARWGFAGPEEALAWFLSFGDGARCV